MSECPDVSTPSSGPARWPSSAPRAERGTSAPSLPQPARARLPGPGLPGQPDGRRRSSRCAPIATRARRPGRRRPGGHRGAAPPGRAAAVEDCARQGRARPVVVITAGFAETGAAGRALRASWCASARAHGMRMVGPNCLGVLNTDAGGASSTPPSPPPARRGRGRVLVAERRARAGHPRLRARSSASASRSSSASATRPTSRATTCSSTGSTTTRTRRDPALPRVVRQPAALRADRPPRRAARKPIVAVKSGRTAAGARAAALAHRRAGRQRRRRRRAVPAGRRHPHRHASRSCSTSPCCSPTSRCRAATASPSSRTPAGPAILAADACESRGLILPPLDGRQTRTALRAFLPPEASVAQPGGHDRLGAAAESYERALRLLLDDPNVDAVLAIFVPPIATRPSTSRARRARRRAGASRSRPTAGPPASRCVTCFMGTARRARGACARCSEGHIPSYVFPESAAIALARAVRLRPLAGAAPRGPDRRARRRHRAAGEPRDRPGAGGRAATARRLARARRGARACWRPTASHAARPRRGQRRGGGARRPTRAGPGGGQAGVAGPSPTSPTWAAWCSASQRADEVRRAFDDIAQAAARDRPRRRDGRRHVQPMARAGVETIIGVTRDPVVRAAGHVRARRRPRRDPARRGRSASTRSPTSTPPRCSCAIRAVKLLEGFRGEPAADSAAWSSSAAAGEPHGGRSARDARARHQSAGRAPARPGRPRGRRPHPRRLLRREGRTVCPTEQIRPAASSARRDEGVGSPPMIEARRSDATQIGDVTTACPDRCGAGSRRAGLAPSPPAAASLAGARPRSGPGGLARPMHHRHLP